MMKATYFSWFALFALCAGLCPSAVSADDSADAPNPAELFETLDKNGDGKLAADEVGEEQAKFFQRLVRVGDDDQDGQLTKDEFVKAAKPEPQPTAAAPEAEKTEGKKAKKGAGRDPKKLFARLDKNGDGKLVKDEVPEKQQKRFERIFAKLGKDEVTLEEFTKFTGGDKGKDAKKKGKKKNPTAEGEQPAAKTATAEGSPDGERPERGPDPERLFKRMDADEDGKLTADEVPEGFKERFAAMLKRAGKDEDGQLNLNEFKRVAHAPRDGEARRRGPRGRRSFGAMRGRFGGPPRPPAFFAKLDKDEDQKLSKEELTGIFALFDELDTNHDGLLDGPELLGFPGRDGDRPAFGRPGYRPERGRRPEMSDERRREFGRRFMERIDTDKDGKISKDEAVGPMKERFDQLDKNSDGYLEGDELRFGRPGRGNGERGRRRSKEKTPEKSDESPAEKTDGKDA